MRMPRTPPPFLGFIGPGCLSPLRRGGGIRHRSRQSVFGQGSARSACGQRTLKPVMRKACRTLGRTRACVHSLAENRVPSIHCCYLRTPVQSRQRSTEGARGTLTSGRVRIIAVRKVGSPGHGAREACAPDGCVADDWRPGLAGTWCGAASIGGE